MEHWIETYTGKQFSLDDPSPDMVCVEDIAHALSMICRFNGHCNRFYSVATHSVLLSNYAHNGAKELLFHDAAEAYIGDITYPFKKMLPDYRRVEDAVSVVIAIKFGVSYPTPDWVKTLDTRILLNERAALMADTGNIWDCDNLEPLRATIPDWSPATAEAAFLDRARALL